MKKPGKSLVFLGFLLLLGFFSIGCELVEEGNGEDGREVEFSTSETHLQWRYVDEDEWRDLIPVEDLEGQDGLSAYEMYLAYNPEYDGSEETWMEDLVNQRLAETVEVRVTFDLQGAPAGEEFESELNAERFTTIDLPEPEWTYHEFKGWHTGFSVNDGRFTNASVVTEDMTLYALWEFQKDRWLDDVNDAEDWQAYREILFGEHLKDIEEENLADYAVLRDVYANLPFEDKDAFDAVFEDAMAFRMATRDAVDYANALEEGDALDLDALIMDVHDALTDGALEYIHDHEVSEMKAHLESLHADLEGEEDLEELKVLLIDADITQFKDILAVIDDYLPDALYLEAGDDLQAAIDSASEGETIEVGPGTFEGALTIETDNLTIRSTHGFEETILDAEGDDLAISVEASGFTLEGFTVENWTDEGVWIFGEENDFVEDVLLKDNHIEAGVSRLQEAIYPIATWYTQGVELSGNTIVVATHDIQESYGVSMYSVSDFTVVDNEFIGGVYPDENYDSHVGIFFGNYQSDPMENVWIEGNTFEGFVYGIKMELWDESDIHDITIKDNHFLENDHGVRFVSWSDDLIAEATFAAFSNNHFESNDIHVLNDSDFDYDLDTILAENTFVPVSHVDQDAIVPKEE